MKILLELLGGMQGLVAGSRITVTCIELHSSKLGFSYLQLRSIYLRETGRHSSGKNPFQSAVFSEQFESPWNTQRFCSAVFAVRKQRVGVIILLLPCKYKLVSIGTLNTVNTPYPLGARPLSPVVA